MLESPFNKVTGQICNFIIKRLQHSCFPVNIAKFLRTGFFICKGCLFTSRKTELAILNKKLCIRFISWVKRLKTKSHRKSEINWKLTKLGRDFVPNILSSIVGNWLDGWLTLKVIAVWIMVMYAEHQTKSKQWCGF